MILSIILIVIICINLLKAHTEEEKLNEKINFLWERYLLLRLYMEYNEQQSDSYPRDIVQASSKYKINFDNLPYFTSKIQDFYFSMKPFWYNLAPELVNELYKIDKANLLEEKTANSLLRRRLEELVQENTDALINDRMYDLLLLKKNRILFLDLSRLRSIQENYEEKLINNPKP